MNEIRPAGYAEFLAELKRRIQTAQLRASLGVNRELVLLYWQIGHEILARQERESWGAKVIDRLAVDLKSAFPDMKGFSPRNLKYMRAFAEAWPEEAIVQQLVAQIPWGHNVRILDYVKKPSAREWYVRATLQRGWSRDVLVHQIESGLHERQGRAVTNLQSGSPFSAIRSGPADHERPVQFRLLDVGNRCARARSRDRSSRTPAQIPAGTRRRFRFCRQSVPTSGRRGRILDRSAVYHLKLRAYVVIDLKMQAFRPEFAGKMNFYLSAVNDLLRHPGDQPSIGLILCNTRDRLVAEYALRDFSKPIGVSEYQLAASLPEKLKGKLPTIEEIESELRQVPE